MEKYSLYPGKSADGRPYVHRIEPGSSHGLGDTEGLTKTASGEHLPGVMELVESLQAQPGRLYLVNSALGAGEYVGFNLRGDWFTEAGLRHTPEGWNDIPVWDIDARRRAANATEHISGWGNVAWGYPTFYNAHRFRHHVNKDPEKAYGFVLGAFWDDRMKRVILVSELIEDKCRNLGALDVYRRIEAGEFPDSSMGSRVPYDRCSICGFIARSPLNYCEHVSKTARPPYGMKALLPDGRRCGVYNDYPRFFDDSFVFIGAERSAKVMTNVTDRVLGNRAYSQTVYPFRKMIVKAASAETPKKPETKAPEAKAKPAILWDLERRLVRVLATVPVTNERERQALEFYMQDKLAQERIKRGLMSPGEYKMWKDLSVMFFRREHGASPESLSFLRDQFDTRLVAMYGGGTKQASMPKWAEMYKKIPAPTAKHLSIVSDASSSMPPLSRDVLDLISRAPHHSLRVAGDMGLVLKPREFQYVMLRHQDQDKARHLWDEKKVFSPSPVLPDTAAFGRSSSIPQDIVSRIAGALSSLFEDRSFAPSAVRIRVMRTRPAPTMEKEATTTIDGLEEIAELYNEYRAGLVAHKPDWSSLAAPRQTYYSLDAEEKLASDASEISDLLLHLAYWPGIRLGLGSPAEEAGTSAPEDATPIEPHLLSLGDENHVAFR